MSSDITIDSKQYISSKRASEMTGYAQDYIGQLARGSQIDARRIGGLWYISPDSILAHQNKAEESKHVPPTHDTHSFPDAEAFVHLDGKEYISASRASKMTGYNQDYVGQLARSGKIMSRQVGNRWYVDKDAILAHQEEKDALLGAVQTESVGISSRSNHDSSNSVQLAHKQLLTYTDESGDLLPAVIQKGALYDAEEPSGSDRVIPIRVITRSSGAFSRKMDSAEERQVQGAPLVMSRKSLFEAMFFPAFALTVVVVLSFGLVSLRKSSSYTFKTDQGVTSITATPRFVASAASGLGSFISMLEDALTTEEVYQRTQ